MIRHPSTETPGRFPYICIRHLPDGTRDLSRWSGKRWMAGSNTIESASKTALPSGKQVGADFTWERHSPVKPIESRR